MPANKWQVFLAESSTMDRVGEITEEAKGKNLKVSLNRGGSFGFNLPFNFGHMDDVIPMKNCIIVQKNDQVVWSGPIWNTTEDFTDARVQVDCVGWIEILYKRFLKAPLTFNDTIAGDIAFALLDNANTDHPTWIIEGDNTDTQVRDMVYEGFQNIGTEIQNLSDIENGYDFYVDPVTRELNISDSQDYTDNTSLIWGFKRGPENIATFSRVVDADAMRNQYLIETSTATYEASESSYWDDYNLFTEVVNISETAEPSTLAAIANAEVAVNKLPRVTLNFAPKAEGSSNVPVLFEDYQIGDKGYVSAERDGQEIVDQAVRVFAADITIEDDGIDKVTSIKTTYE